MNNDNPQQEALPLDGKGLEPNSSNTDDALKSLIAAIELPQYASTIYYEHPSKTYDSSYGGGDCLKHGRYYGICHSCNKDFEQAKKDADREVYWERERAISQAVQNAKLLLNSVQNVQGSVATESDSSSTADNKNKNPSSQEVSQQDDREVYVPVSELLITDEGEFSVIRNGKVEKMWHKWDSDYSELEHKDYYWSHWFETEEDLKNWDSVDEEEWPTHFQKKVKLSSDRDAALVSFGNFLLSDKRKSDYPVVTDGDIENWKEETKGGDV